MGRRPPKRWPLILWICRKCCENGRSLRRRPGKMGREKNRSIFKTDMASERLIVGITGATGIIFGVRLLQVLQDTAVETHLVVSKWAGRTLMHETPYTLEQVQQMATRTYAVNDQGAAISSGSFITAGMVVIPCSMRTLAAIAHGQ